MAHLLEPSVADRVDLELECLEQVPEGALAQVAAVEGIDVEDFSSARARRVRRASCGVIVDQFRGVQALDGRRDAVELFRVLPLQTHRDGGGAQIAGTQLRQALHGATLGGEVALQSRQAVGYQRTVQSQPAHQRLDGESLGEEREQDRSHRKGDEEVTVLEWRQAQDDGEGNRAPQPAPEDDRPICGSTSARRSAAAARAA